MKRTFFRLLLASVTSFLLYSSCTKLDTTSLGSDLIPVVDNINTFQTILDVQTDNLLMTDSTKMYGQDYGVGYIESDPEFGKTTATLYFTTEPQGFGSYPFLKRDTVYIDSLILSLGYKSLYGDSNSVENFEVRELDYDADFKKNTAYRIDHYAFPTVPAVLGSKQVAFTTLNDSVKYANFKDTIKTTGELRIPLDTSFGRRFIEYDTAGAYKNDSIFKTKFKGFEVKVNKSNSGMMNAIAYFDLGNTDRTKLTFYCRVMRNGKWDTINPSFIYSNDPRANVVTREASGNYANNLDNGNPNDELLYIQSNPGSYATLKIPGIDTLNNRVIHLAELIAEKIPTAGENYFAPPQFLFLDALSTTGDSVFTIRHDFIPGPNTPGYDISVFGGAFANNRYVFNISRYLQKIVTDKNTNYTLRLYAPYSTEPYYIDPSGTVDPTSLYLLINKPIGAGRVVLGGGTHPTKRLRLRIIYSKI